MGIPSELRRYWGRTTRNDHDQSIVIASPAEEQRVLEARQESVTKGFKAAAIAAVATAIPTVIAVRTIPWAKANINHTGQALIVSAASIAAFFITADKTTLETARRNTHYDKTA